MRIGALLAAWGRPQAADAGVALSGSSQHALKTYHLSSIDVFRDLPRSEVERLAETTRMNSRMRRVGTGTNPQARANPLRVSERVIK